jgi:hypothetical protein
MMSESIQVLPTIEFSSDSGTESASKTNPGSFHGESGSFSMGLWNTSSIHQEINSSLLHNSSVKLGPFPFGLNNMAKSCQILLQEEARSMRAVPLKEPKKALYWPWLHKTASSTSRVVSLGVAMFDWLMKQWFYLTKEVCFTTPTPL